MIPATIILVIMMTALLLPHAVSSFFAFGRRSVAFRPLTTARSTTAIEMMIPSDPPSSASTGSYSYVEDGDFFESDWDEIEAMGGDPFFLDSSSSSSEEDEDSKRISGSEQNNKNDLKNVAPNDNFESDWEEVEAIGGDPFFLEDPTERNDEVKRDLITPNVEEESKASAVNSILASDGDFASDWSQIQAIGGGSINPWVSSNTDGLGRIRNEEVKGVISSMMDTVQEGGFFESDWDEIEYMGGDPSFLAFDDEGGSTVAETKSSSTTMSNESEEDDFFWDGEVDEDAYFD